MNTQYGLFTNEELLRFEAQRSKHLRGTAKLPWTTVLTLIFAAGFSFVSFIEWEIIYQVFDYLVGDSAETWSPGLMACTGLIMIIGFHLHAKDNPDNFSVRFVDKAAALLIPVYLVGMGLLVASVLYKDGLSEMIAPEAQIVIGQISQAVENGVIDTIFANVTNPLAVLVSSLGIGGLAIMNIFVAHRLLTMITKNLNEMVTATQKAKETIKDHKIILRTQADYAALEGEENDLLMRDDNYIALSITGIVLAEISQALLPHKQWLKENEYGHPTSRFEAGEPVDAKRVAKDVAKIGAITQQDILSALKPSLLEDQ